MPTEDHDDRGLRTWSQVTIELDVAHDGDPQRLAEHLAVEVEHLIRRTPGVGLLDLNTSATVRSARG